MLLLGIDTETTGFSFEDDRVTEIGAVLYDTELLQPVSIYSELIDEPGREPLKPIITKLTGITDEMILNWGFSPMDAAVRLSYLLDKCDYVVAHNAPFDKGMLKGMHDRLGILMTEKPWIDTTKDLPIDKELCKHTNLLYLAAHHGIINPFSHRAVTDVLTMLTIMGKYNFDEIIKRFEAPVAEVWCFPGFTGKDKPKAAGFYYTAKDKSWRKELSSIDVDFMALEDGSLFDFDYQWRMKNRE